MATRAIVVNKNHEKLTNWLLDIDQGTTHDYFYCTERFAKLLFDRNYFLHDENTFYLALKKNYFVISLFLDDDQFNLQAITPRLVKAIDIERNKYVQLIIGHKRFLEHEDAVRDLIRIVISSYNDSTRSWFDEKKRLMQQVNNLLEIPTYERIFFEEILPQREAEWKQANPEQSTMNPILQFITPMKSWFHK